MPDITLADLQEMERLAEIHAQKGWYVRIEPSRMSAIIALAKDGLKHRQSMMYEEGE